MRASRQTGRRLIVITVVTFVAAVATVALVGRWVVRSLAAERVAELLADAVPAAAITDCRAGRPRAVLSSAEVEFQFYDAAGVPLADAAAPRIDPELWSRLRRSGGHSAGRFDRATSESLALLLLADAGPCRYAQARWRRDERAARLILTAIGLCTAAVALVLAALVAGFVARPLLLRLRDLRLAAQALGTERFSSAPKWPDEAGDISLALNDAHARIRAQAHHLAERAASLEWVLATGGHDMRTPLASLQFGLDELAELAPATMLPVLRRALNDVIYLRSLTANLRLAARLRGGQWNPITLDTTICISKIAERVVERAAAFALRCGLDLVHAIAPGLHTRGDETCSEQVLTNLVENAIAHSTSGTRVSVAVTQVGEYVRVVIEDDGPGLLPDSARTPAARPEEAQRRDGRQPGLGLEITRTLCERSQWLLRFERAEPKGLRVRIEAKLDAGFTPKDAAAH